MKKITVVVSVLSITIGVCLLATQAYERRNIPDTVHYSIIHYDHQPPPTDMVFLEIEIDLVNGRLPNKEELAAVTNGILSTHENASVIFTEFYLPHMNRKKGAYATDHRGNLLNNAVTINTLFLRDTVYQHLM